MGLSIPSPVEAGIIETFADANGRTLAIVVRSRSARDKYNFFTPPESPLQVGVNFYTAGETIKPHLHPEQERTISQSQECIIVRRGEMTYYVFDEQRRLVGQTVLHEGDIVLQSIGGHAFRVTKDTEIVEVKQGPFGGEADKIRFESPLP